MQVTVIPYAFSSVIKQLQAVQALEAKGCSPTEQCSVSMVDDRWWMVVMVVVVVVVDDRWWMVVVVRN